MMFRFKIFILTLFTCIQLYSQTESTGLQYIFNYGTINPAAISVERKSLQLYYRNQLNGIEQAPQTQYLSFQMPLDATTPVGFALHNTTSGPASLSGIQLRFAHIIPINSLKISFGIQGEIKQKILDETQFVLENEYDDAISGIIQKRVDAQSATGIYIAANNWHIGMSVFDLLSENSIYTKQVKFSSEELCAHLYADYRMSWNNRMELLSSVLLVKDSEIMANLNFLTNWNHRFNFGTSFTTQKDIAILFGTSSNNLSIQYMQSLNNTFFTNLSKGTSEIMLVFIF